MCKNLCDSFSFRGIRDFRGSKIDFRDNRSAMALQVIPDFWVIDECDDWVVVEVAN